MTIAETNLDNTRSPDANLKAEEKYDLAGDSERDQGLPPDATRDNQVVNDGSEQPPDGGAAAWLVVLGAWCCSFFGPGWVNSVGSFQGYYEVGPLRDYSSSTIAWIRSLQLFFMFAMGPVVGIIFNKYEPRTLILGGTLLHVFGLMMASLATNNYQFILAQGICSAIGVAAVYAPALACPPTWFSAKRGAALGIVTTGASLGGVIFHIMISRMIDRVGYPWAMRTGAFLILGLQTVAILTVWLRTKPPPKTLSAGRFAAPFAEVPFVLLLGGMFVLTFGILIPINYLAVQGREEAPMSESMTQYLVSIFNAASLFGLLASGFGADSIGCWNMFILACGLSGVAELTLWIPATHPSVAIGFAVLFGFASGAFIGLSGALPMAVSPPAEVGYRLGLVFLVISVPALIMVPIAGAILQNATDG